MSSFRMRNTQVLPEVLQGLHFILNHSHQVSLDFPANIVIYTNTGNPRIHLLAPEMSVEQKVAVLLVVITFGILHWCDVSKVVVDLLSVFESATIETENIQ